MNNKQTYYPFGHKHDEITEGLAKLSGKKITLGRHADDEESKQAKEAFKLFKMLALADHYMAPVLNYELGSINRTHSERLAAREAELCHSIRYDQPQAGHVSFKGNTSVSEMYVDSECDADDEAQALYESNFLPILKVHNCLLRNCETMFEGNGSDELLTDLLLKTIRHGDDLRYVFTANTFGTKYGGTRPSEAWRLIMSRALSKDNGSGYLYFPAFTDIEIEFLCTLHKIRPSVEQKNEALAKCGLCEAELADLSPKKNAYFRALGQVTNDWENHSYIKKLMEDPNSASVNTAFRYYLSDNRAKASV